MTKIEAESPQSLSPDVGPVAHALSEDSIRTILRENVELISALIDTAPKHDMTAEELAALMGEPQLFNAILAHGLDCTPQEAAAMSLLAKALTLGKILDLTSKEHDGFPLGALFREELFSTTLLLNMISSSSSARRMKLSGPSSQSPTPLSRTMPHSQVGGI